MRRLAVVLTVGALVVAAPSVASADEPIILSEPPPDSALETQTVVTNVHPSRVRLLEAWLAYSSDEAKRARRIAGGTSIVFAAALIGAGAALYVDSTPRTELDQGAGLVTLALGGAFLTGGIAALAIRSSAEKRYDSWDRAVEEGVSATEFARYEGELRATLRSGSALRRASRWSNLGIAVSGILILAVTPAANLSSDGRRVGYIVGGVLAGAGALGFGLSFIKTADLWQRYENGDPPTGKSRGWLYATPTFNQHGGGVAVAGRF